MSETRPTAHSSATFRRRAAVAGGALAVLMVGAGACVATTLVPRQPDVAPTAATTIAADAGSEAANAGNNAVDARELLEGGGLMGSTSSEGTSRSEQASADGASVSGTQAAEKGEGAASGSAGGGTGSSGGDSAPTGPDAPGNPDAPASPEAPSTPSTPTAPSTPGGGTDVPETPPRRPTLDEALAGNDDWTGYY